MFSERTFELLSGIHQDPTFRFYDANREEFKHFVEQPYKNLFLTSIRQMHPEILESMEIEKDLFSRFNKNDHGVGGAWDFYWSAIYPKGGKRTTSPQLFMVIDRNHIQAGFSVADYYDDQAKRKFSVTCRSLAKELVSTFEKALKGVNVIFGMGTEGDDNIRQPLVINSTPSLQAWMENPELYGIRLAVELTKDDILTNAPEFLVNAIVKTFNIFFVFMLIASKEEPAQPVRDYLTRYYTGIGEGGSDGYHLEQPLYSLEGCSTETGINLGDLQRWVGAIERKKQAIFYGPSGNRKNLHCREISQAPHRRWLWLL